jgi:hypothetical protein
MVLIFLFSLVSGQVFVGDDVVVSVYEDYLSNYDSSFGIFVTDFEGDSVCEFFVYSEDFVSGEVSGSIFSFDTFSQDVVYVTYLADFDDCSLTELYSGMQEEVDCDSTEDCGDYAACVTDTGDDFFGHCGMCHVSDNSLDYEFPGILYYGVSQGQLYTLDDLSYQYPQSGVEFCSPNDGKLMELYCSSGSAVSSHADCNTKVGSGSVCIGTDEGLGYCSPATGESEDDNEIDVEVEEEEMDYEQDGYEQDDSEDGGSVDGFDSDDEQDGGSYSDKGETHERNNGPRRAGKAVNFAFFKPSTWF